MKILKIPHQLADYLCPINGLCDIYEWKTGNRIPDDLLFYSKAGFQLISQKRATPPKMIFFGQSSIGKREYNYWKNLIGYEIVSNEGRTFKTTLKEIQSLLDNDVPTILFGLDMYHLPYQQKFYHECHIPGHVVLMVGYDEKNVYVHDNSKIGVQTVPVDNLRLAWANDYIGISKRNAYFGIDMKSPNHDISHIIQQGISRNANLYLNAPLGFIGIKGMSKFIKEFPSWEKTFSEEELKNIYSHFVEYSGSVLPELPHELSNHNSGIDNPHRASRDKLAAALLNYKSTFGTPHWEEAAHHFQLSGAIIESIVSGFVEDIQHQTFSRADRYIPLFEKLKEVEREAFKPLLHTREIDRSKKAELIL